MAPLQTSPAPAVALSLGFVWHDLRRRVWHCGPESLRERSLAHSAFEAPSGGAQSRRRREQSALYAACFALEKLLESTSCFFVTAFCVPCFVERMRRTPSPELRLRCSRRSRLYSHSLTPSRLVLLSTSTGTVLKEELRPLPLAPLTASLLGSAKR